VFLDLLIIGKLYAFFRPFLYHLPFSLLNLLHGKVSLYYRHCISEVLKKTMGKEKNLRDFFWGNKRKKGGMEGSIEDNLIFYKDDQIKNNQRNLL